MWRQGSKLNREQMKELLLSTNFTRHEIKDWYKRFIKDYPTGKVSREEFKALYTNFFRSGDASLFAGHVFRTFDRNQNGFIDFREFLCSLSVTSRGRADEKVRWAFTMYDTDGSGFITKSEMMEVIQAVYKMYGSQLRLREDEMTPEKRVEKLFKMMDKDGDSRLTMKEFREGAREDPNIVEILHGNYA